MRTYVSKKIERLVVVSVVGRQVVWYWELDTWMIEQDQRFGLDNSVSTHAYPNHQEETPHTSAAIYILRYIIHIDAHLVPSSKVSRNRREDTKG